MVRLSESLAEFVARRPKLVIALWVLMLLLSAPLAPMLEKYISYSESKWLPSNAESIRASKILENLGGGRGSSVFLVVVSSRPFALDSAMIVEEMTERFASEYGVKADVIGPAGIAELVAENLARILEGGLKAVNGTAKGFYSVALAASEAYKGAKKGAIAAWMLVQGYLTLLGRAREIYDGVKNATSMFTTYYSYLSKGLQELDKAYAMVLSTMKTLHHVAWPFASCNLTNRSSYTPPSPETAVGELLQAIEGMNETVPAKISGFSIGVDELVKIMKYVEELGPCPSEADYRSAAKTYIASVVEEKYGASMARLVKALLDLIDAFGGPGLQPTKTKSVVEYVFTKLLGKMLAQYGLSLPPSWIKNIVQLVGEEDREQENLTAIFVRAMVASYIEREGGASAKKLVDIILAGRDPVVELIIERQGLVQPTSTSARQALYNAMIELGIPDWMAKLALETSSQKEFVDRVLEQTLKIFLEKLKKKVDEKSYSLLAELVQDIFENEGKINRTLVATISAKRVFESIGPMVRVFEEAYGIRVPAFQILEQVALTAINGEKVELGKLLTGIKRDIEKQVFSSLKGRMISDDGTTILVIVKYDTGNETTIYNATVFLEEKLRSKGYKCYAMGGAYERLEVRKSISQDISRVDKLSAAMVLIVLLAVMEAFAASILPFFAIGVSVLLGTAMVALLAMHGASVTSWARSMMITTALGLGIDYTAYVVMRVREELARGGDPRDAIRRGLAASIAGVAGSAITDFLGFASFLLAWDMPFLKSLGIALPPVVLAVALASVTLVPAVLTFVAEKRWFWWPRRVEVRERKTPLVARLSVSKPSLVLLILVLLAVPAAYNLMTFTGSYDLKLFMPEGSSIVKGIAILEEKLTPGKLFPVDIVVVLKSKYGLAKVLELSESLIGNITAEINTTVYGPTRPQGRPVDPQTILEAGKAGLSLASQYVYNTTSSTIFTVRVELYVNPLSSEGLKLVAKVHSIAHEWAKKEAGVVDGVFVGGVPATIYELNVMMSREFLLRVLPVAALSMALSMYVVFRILSAALLPLVSVALGVSYAVLTAAIVFNKFAGIGLLWFLPTVVAVAALGVGMDYNSFYINRLLEEASRVRPRDAALAASAATTRLILGLSLIVSSSYSAMIFTRSWGLRELGASLALAIVFTSLIAVVALWPSVTTLMGDRTWWPRRMRRGVYVWELGRGVKIEESPSPEHL